MVLFIVFLVFKLWALGNRCIIMSKRPLASNKFAIGKWNSLFNLMSLFLPFHIGLFISLRTTIIERTLQRPVPDKNKGVERDILYNMYVFSIFAHLTIIVNAILRALIKTKPDWLVKVQNNEQVLKEQY